MDALFSLHNTMSRYSDYVPFVSTYESSYFLFQKYVLGINRVDSSNKMRIYSYINRDHGLRRVILLVPILGNVTILIYDFVQISKTQELYYKAQIARDKFDCEEALKIYHQLAAEGHLEAMVQIGILHEAGSGVEKDHDLAAYWYLKAAEKEHTFAMYLLGKLNEPTDKDIAFHWYHQAAEKGLSDAIQILSKKYLQSISTIPADAEIALRWLTVLAQKGHVNSMIKLGKLYKTGLGTVPVDHVKAIYWLTQAASKNDLLAMHLLANLYEENKVYISAMYWYTEAANKDYIPSMLALGTCYDHGRLGFPPNREQALHWYTQAAQKESPEAMVALGDLYRSPRWPNDFNRALFWYQKAAKKGYAMALYKISSLYDQRDDKHNCQVATKWLTEATLAGNPDAMNRFGEKQQHGSCGFPVNYQEALLWYKRAAERNHIGSFFNLGYMHYKGQGTPINHPEALKCYLKAAENGHVSSMFNAGLMYKNGEGIEYPDDNLAIHWLEKAVRGGDTRAQAVLNLTQRHRPRLNVDFSKCLLAHMRVASVQLLLEKVYSQEDIESMMNPSFEAVIKYALYKMLICSVLNANSTAITFPGGNQLSVTLDSPHALFGLRDKLIQIKQGIANLSQNCKDALILNLTAREAPNSLSNQELAATTLIFNKITAVTIEINNNLINNNRIVEADKVNWSEAYSV
jgi:TPR repeat protein